MTETIQGFRLSPQQRQLWLHSRVGPGYHAACTLELCDATEPGRVREALGRLVARHEILRTHFETPEGLRVPVQVVDQEGDVDWSIEEISNEDPVARRQELSALEERVRGLPFDLRRGPVLRARWVRAGSDGRWLVLALPSVCADRSTLCLLVEELAALLVGGEPEGEGEALQYAQYAEWRWGVLQDPESAEGMARWQELAPALATPVRLPGERPVEAPAPFAPDAVEAEVGPAVLERLRRLGSREELGMRPLLLAAWQAVLARLGDGSQTLLGVVADERGYEELSGVAGPLAETLPVVLDAALDRRFVDAARGAAEAVAEAVEWQEYFEPEGLLPPGPVPIPHGFEYQELAPRAASVGPLRWCSQRVHGDRFRLKLSCSDFGTTLLATLHYDPEAVDPVAAERLLARFRTLLAAAAEGPESPLVDLDLLAPDERRELIEALNQTAVPRPAALLHELVEASVDKAPEAVAVVHGSEHLSYRGLDERANLLARRLRAAGVGPDELVGLYLDRSPDLLVAILAASKAGGAYLPLDPLHPPARLAEILDGSRPRVTVARGPVGRRVSESGTTVLRLDDEDGEGDETPLAPAAPESLAYVLHTSGSTGRPKGVMVAHAGLVNNLLWAIETYGLGTGDRIPVHSPLGFDLTLTSLLGPLVAGATLELLPELEGADSLATAMAAAPGYALVKLTPLHLGLLAEQLPDGRGRARVGTLVLGGEALDRSVLDSWWQGAPETTAFNEYGPTETVVGVSAFRATAGATEPGGVPIGRPISNARLYLADRRGRLAPAGVPGEILIGGVCVARGYLGQPAQTAERFVPDPFGGESGGRLYRTGDLARLGADGEVRFLGRTDHQLKVRGVRVEPEEVEKALEAHPAVRDAVVNGWKDNAGELRLAAYLLTDDESTPSTDELRSFLLDRLPEMMIPTAFLWLESFPETPNRKVDRAALPRPGTQRPDLRGTYIAPRTEVEEALAAIWGEVLGVDQVGVEDSFFALGGDSIRSVRVVATAQERGLEFTVQDLFRHQTVARLAEHLRPPGEAAGGEEAEELTTLVDEVEELSPAEVRRRLRELREEDRAS